MSEKGKKRKEIMQKAKNISSCAFKADSDHAVKEEASEWASMLPSVLIAQWAGSVCCPCWRLIQKVAKFLSNIMQQEQQQFPELPFQTFHLYMFQQFVGSFISLGVQ